MSIALKNKIKRKVFFFTIKSPFCVLLIITLTIVGLLSMAFFSKTSVYLEQKGTMVILSEKTSKAYIQIHISDETYKNQISTESYVLWYVEPDGNRYTAPIIETKHMSTQNDLILTVEPLLADVRKEFGDNILQNSPVNTEVFLRKERVLDQIKDWFLKKTS